MSAPVPELECVGGPLDGRMYRFYGDEFRCVAGLNPLFDAPVSEQTVEQRQLPVGMYRYEPHHKSPTTGATRMVWLWHPPETLATGETVGEDD